MRVDDVSSEFKHFLIIRDGFSTPCDSRVKRSRANERIWHNESVKLVTQIIVEYVRNRTFLLLDVLCIQLSFTEAVSNPQPPFDERTTTPLSAIEPGSGRSCPNANAEPVVAASRAPIKVAVFRNVFIIDS